MEVWRAPEVNCVDWYIGPTDRELSVLLQKREGKNEPQSIYELGLMQISDSQRSWKSSSTIPERSSQ